MGSLWGPVCRLCVGMCSRFHHASPIIGLNFYYVGEFRLETPGESGVGEWEIPLYAQAAFNKLLSCLVTTRLSLRPEARVCCGATNHREPLADRVT